MGELGAAPLCHGGVSLDAIEVYEAGTVYVEHVAVPVIAEQFAEVVVDAGVLVVEPGGVEVLEVVLLDVPVVVE